MQKLVSALHGASFVLVVASAPLGCAAPAQRPAPTPVYTDPLPLEPVAVEHQSLGEPAKSSDGSRPPGEGEGAASAAQNADSADSQETPDATAPAPSEASAASSSPVAPTSPPPPPVAEPSPATQSAPRAPTHKPNAPAPTP